MAKNLYLARLERQYHCVQVGICKHYVYEEKNIMSFRFVVDTGLKSQSGIFELLAEQIKPCEDLAGEYKCHMSFRQFGSEKHEVEAEWDTVEKVLKFNNNHFKVFISANDFTRV